VQASTTSATTAQVKNVWLSPAEGFPLAKKLNKPVMVDFYTDWCGWCHVLEEKTFKDPTVSKLLKDNFVLVKANAEDSGDGTKLASMLRVNGFPTTWFFQPSGDPIGYISGFKPPEVFKLVIGELLAGKFTARANAQVMPAGTEVTTPATLVSPPAPPAPPRAP
jgi:thiol:disulfide interchange protein